MPIYTYRCESCGVRFERQQGFNDPVLNALSGMQQESAAEGLYAGWHSLQRLRFLRHRSSLPIRR